MSSLTEKLISDIQSLGCVDLVDAQIAAQVYLELSEIKRYWDVSYHFDTALTIVYITAKKTKDGCDNIFIPWLNSKELSFMKLQELHELSRKHNLKSFFLSLITSDSTCVYYELIDGLEEPTDISAKHLKENKQAKLDADIRKHRNLLEQSALYGIPITLNKPTSQSSTKK